MFEVTRLSLILPSILAFNIANVHSSSFSEIELVETNEWEEISFSFCFNEHYNDINIQYQETFQIAQCFYDTSRQLHQTYCNSKSPILLNDLISGLEYTLSWLEQSKQFPTANNELISKQTQVIRNTLDELTQLPFKFNCVLSNEKLNQN